MLRDDYRVEVGAILHYLESGSDSSESEECRNFDEDNAYVGILSHDETANNCTDAILGHGSCARPRGYVA